MSLRHTRIVSWSSHREALQRIRQAVFIEEQGVPHELEWDDQDATAMHVLSYDAAGRAVATARLLQEAPEVMRIGRLAVLKEQRGQGLGSGLMRFLLGLARSEGAVEVNLSAQVQLVPWYRGLGFTPQSGEYMDAGIRHQTMRCVLNDRKDRPPRQLGRDDRVYRLQHAADSLEHLQEMAAQAQRKVLILSRDLDRGVLDAPEFVAALTRMARRSPQTQIDIMLTDQRAVVGQSHALIQCVKRLPSHFQCRVPTPRQELPAYVFVLIDDCGIVFRHEADGWTGFATYHDPGTALRLGEEFRQNFNRAKRSLELRQMPL